MPINHCNSLRLPPSRRGPCEAIRQTKLRQMWPTWRSWWPATRLLLARMRKIKLLNSPNPQPLTPKMACRSRSQAATLRLQPIRHLEAITMIIKTILVEPLGRAERKKSLRKKTSLPRTRPHLPPTRLPTSPRTALPATSITPRTTIGQPPTQRTMLITSITSRTENQEIRMETSRKKDQMVKERQRTTTRTPKGRRSMRWLRNSTIIPPRASEVMTRQRERPMRPRSTWRRSLV